MYGGHHGLSMDSHHALDDLAGTNLGIENVIYSFPRVLLSTPPQPRLASLALRFATQLQRLGIAFAASF
jgi:hypothetical protein